MRSVFIAFQVAICAAHVAAAAEPAKCDVTVDLASRPGTALINGILQITAGNAARDSIRLQLWSEMKNVRLAVDDGAAEISHDDAQGDRTWTLKLRAPVPPRAISVQFSMETDATAPQFSAAATGAYAGDGEIWYPRESFDQLTTGSLQIVVPNQFEVVATGTRIARRGGTFVYDVRRPAHYAFAAARYVSVKPHAASLVTLHVQRLRPGAEDMARRIERVLSELSRLFGPLPNREFAVAEVRFSGSVAGLGFGEFFLADGQQLDRGLPTPFIAHELAHAWWGNAVATKPGPGRMLLTEGLASFAMLNVLEAVEGSEAARKFRMCEYPGYRTSGCPEEYFRLAAAGLELPLATQPTGGRETMLMHRMANTKGPFCFMVLSQSIGPSRFRALLKRIVGEHTGSALSWSEFTEYVIRDSPRAAAVINDCFNRTGVPQLAQPDPEFQLLRWTPEIRAKSAALSQFTKADWERRFGDRKTAIAMYRAAMATVPRDDEFGVGFRLDAGLGRALFDNEELTEARATLERSLQRVVREPELLPTVYLYLARIARRMGEIPLMIRHATAAIEADRLVNRAAGVTDEAQALLEGASKEPAAALSAHGLSRTSGEHGAT